MSTDERCCVLETIVRKGGEGFIQSIHESMKPTKKLKWRSWKPLIKLWRNSSHIIEDPSNASNGKCGDLCLTKSASASASRSRQLDSNRIQNFWNEWNNQITFPAWRSLQPKDQVWLNVISDEPAPDSCPTINQHELLGIRDQYAEY